MYKINLFPEYAEKRRQRRQRTVLVGCLTVVAGLQVFLIGSQVLNIRTADERAAALRDELLHLEQLIAKEQQPSPEIRVAQELIELRRTRTDWAPLMSSLSLAVDSSFYLTNLMGDVKETGTTFTVTGEMRADDGQIEKISLFLRRLRDDAAFSGALASVELGKVQGGKAREFEVICRSGEVQQ